MNVTTQNPNHVHDLVHRIRLKFQTDQTYTYAWRAKQLKGLITLLETHEQEILDALAADLGKPKLEALTSEILYVTSEAKDVLRHLKRWMKPQRQSIPIWLQPATAHVVHDPLGVVLIIAPWNYPVQLCLAPLIGAISGGNCAVIKPSEMTPQVSSLLTSLLPKYLDKDAFAVVEGGVDITSSLLEEKWDHIFFTGSPRVGQIIMEAAARQLCPVTLELGGKTPCIIDENTNLEIAAKRVVWGKFFNSGQSCIAPDYLLVHERVYEDFLTLLAQAVRDFHSEDVRAQSAVQEYDPTCYAKIVNDAHYNRLMSLLPDVDRIVVGGCGDEETRSIEPTVLRDVALNDPVMAEEIFGPILPTVPISSIEEAFQIVAQGAKPLAAYIFTQNKYHAEYAQTYLRCGAVVVNHVILHFAAANLPFGGVGLSGMGAYHGRYSFDTFTHTKPVLNKPTWFDLPIMYPPYTGFKERILSLFLR